jgi:hypothetical protein
VPDAVIALTELVVGAGCLVAALGAWRRAHLPWLAAVLSVAGAAAIAHAVVWLA